MEPLDFSGGSELISVPFLNAGVHFSVIWNNYHHCTASMFMQSLFTQHAEGQCKLSTALKHTHTQLHQQLTSLDFD